MKLSAPAKAVLAAFCGNLIFGFSFLFSKLALSAAQPSVLLFWRFLLAFAVLNLLLLLGKGKISLRGKNPLSLLLLGLFQPICYFLCENYGILYTNATFSAVMIALVPIASLLFGLLFLKEIPTVPQVGFSLLSIAGVLVMALRQSSDGSVRPLGILLLVGAVLSGVGFNLVSRKSATDFSAFERTYAMFLMGCIFFAILAVFENRNSLILLVQPLQSPAFLLSVGYLGIISSVCAFLMLNYATTYLPVARTTAFSNITTVASVFAGVLFLHEPFSALSLVASVMIIAGIYGVQKFARRAPCC